MPGRVIRHDAKLTVRAKKGLPHLLIAQLVRRMPDRVIRHDANVTEPVNGSVLRATG
jgi:hypothetical protein